LAADTPPQEQADKPVEQVVGELERSETEKIIIQLKEYRGRHYVDFRLHFLADEDEWRPTQKGITVAPRLWEEFKDFVADTDKLLREQGLLP